MPFAKCIAAGDVLFCVPKENQKAPATFEAREARIKGYSPLIIPKEMGSIQKIQVAPLEDFCVTPICSRLRDEPYGQVYALSAARQLQADSSNMPFPVTTLSREKVNSKSPQAFRIYKFKKYISAEHAQSETEGILNHLLEETRKYMNHLGDYDVIVIGAGHAGIEAAHAAATLGARTAVFTMSLDAIGNMPCNPSIGGTAKGTLVRELDALGGVMGLAADATYLQSRMLNKGKGPAVHALRVQTDRKRYHEYMKHALELTPGLAIHQAEVVSIETENGRVKGVVTQLNGEYSAKCVVIATGTNLGGKIFVGDAWYASGPDGMHAANALTDSLKAAGLPLRRFKTGTPARVHRRSIDFSKLECQPGDPDNELQPFSFMTDAPMHNKVECWIAYTNPETHRIILDNIQRSPLYGGMIEGVGPRYCPSIEDKVVRFAARTATPFLWNPAARTPKRCICRVPPAACRRMCRMPSTAVSKGLRTSRSCARPTPSSTTAWTPPVWKPRWKARWCGDCTVRVSSTAPLATRKLPPRACWPD